MKSLSALVAGALLSVHAFATESVWPNGAKAAVSLAYDDAMPTHLDNAIPQLDKHGFKASFYINIGARTIRPRMDEWRAIAENGHELGNHTINHSCRGSVVDISSWLSDWSDLDNRTVEEVASEVLVANTFLQAIDGKTQRTFTAPCGHWETSNGNYNKAVKEHFIAIKALPSTEVEDLDDIQFHRMGFFTPSDVSGKELIEFVKKAAKKGSVANITFHGVGGDYLAVSNKAHKELLAYLDENRETYWVDTFANIMSHLKKHREE